MYAIANMFYGYPLVSNDPEAPSPIDSSELIAQALENDVEGFFRYYSGAGHDPAAFGVELGEFDEACAFVPLASICTVPSPAQVEQFQQSLALLDPALQAALQALGAPSIFLLWSTS